MTSTYRWLGGNGAESDPANWVLDSGNGNASGVPENGDIAIVTAGDVQTAVDTELNGNLIELSGATIEFSGDSGQQALLDSNTQLITSVAGVTTPADSTLKAFGNVTNAGMIDADGPAGSTLTINIETLFGGPTQTGFFINAGTIEAEAGNTVTILIGNNDELVNDGAIVALGGHIDIQAGFAFASGSIAADTGFFLIAQGGSIETNASPSGTGGHDPIYAFIDANPGNTLKIDDIASFGGQIFGFGTGDTIDLGANLSVATVVYDETSGILELEDSGNNVLASLDFISGAFQSGTFSVDPVTGQAGSFTIGTSSTDGDTVLTTSAVNGDIYSNVDGTWQTATNWSTGVPGVNDSVIIGLNGSSGFTLDTGTSPVTVAGLYLLQDTAALSVTSNLTMTAYGIDAFGGIIDIQSGNTLTTTQLEDTGAVTTVEQASTLVLTGHPVVSIAASGGQLSLANISAGADISGGALYVAGDVEATTSAMRVEGSALGPGQIVVEAGGTINAQMLELDYGGSLVMQGGTVNAQTLDVEPGGTLEGYGKVTGISSNAWNIQAGDGTYGETLEIDHGVGTLGFASGATLEIDNSIDASAYVEFWYGNAETLLIDSAALLPTNDFTIDHMQAGDRLEFGPGITATNAVLSGTTLTVDITGPDAPSGSSTLTFDNVTNVQGSFFTAGIDATTGDSFVEVACYCPGTLIRTARGEKSIEKLKIGDKVMTASGALRPIKWIGQRSYGGRFLLGRTDILPICIKAGALAPNVPRRDLWISPHHAMFLDGLLIEAKDLVNGVSIVQAEQVDEVDYVHIELETHDVIIAEDALSETFLDDNSRMMFHNAAEYYELYPDAATAPAGYCAPRRDDGFEVEAVRRRIAVRAGLSAHDDTQHAGTLRGYVDLMSPERIAGWAQAVDYPDAPVCLDIRAGGELLGQVLANRYREDLAEAGIGNGCHGFEFIPPARLTVSSADIEVRRSIDGAEVELSLEARTALPESARTLHAAKRKRPAPAACSADIRAHRRLSCAG
jgi:hypothetical protein